MGKRGPKTQPKTSGEPGPIPDPPEWMTDDRAIAVWNKYATALNALGLLESLDTLAFAMLCESAVSYVDARSQLSPHELVQMVGENGALQQNPLVSIIRQLSKGTLDLFAEFGLTPASRTALTGSTAATPPGDNIDPFEAVLNEYDSAINHTDPPVTPRKRAAKKKAVAKKRPARKAVKKRPVKKAAIKKRKPRTK